MLIALVDPYTFISIVFGPLLLFATLVFGCTARYEMKVRRCQLIRRLRDTIKRAQPRYRACRLYGVVPPEADLAYRTACFHLQEALDTLDKDPTSAENAAKKGLAHLINFKASMDKM